MEEEHITKNQTLAWKASNDFMATNEALWRHHMRESASCIIYNHLNETILHATMACNLVKSVWDKGELG